MSAFRLLRIGIAVGVVISLAGDLLHGTPVLPAHVAVFGGAVVCLAWESFFPSARATASALANALNTRV